MPFYNRPVAADSDPDPGGPDQVAATIRVSVDSPVMITQDAPVRGGDLLRWKFRYKGNPAAEFFVKGVGGSSLPLNDADGNSKQVAGRNGTTPFFQVFPITPSSTFEFEVELIEPLMTGPVARGVILVR